ncbi:MAG: hypothetical protein EZS28_023166 [Streblomastix strix]|uniref:Uncharacterized protein n=1 Tax=Streblomastix strix TaxID=222440 RepID=A0A5J4VFN8_9EUKA|nr:MAG: hypothetical protein EZS28_023166 [Streblomastix strix]
MIPRLSFTLTHGLSSMAAIVAKNEISKINELSCNLFIGTLQIQNQLQQVNKSQYIKSPSQYQSATINLPDILRSVDHTAQFVGMAVPVEMEFACNLTINPPELVLLQLRPMVSPNTGGMGGLELELGQH